jgi:hypothetical protein
MGPHGTCHWEISGGSGSFLGVFVSSKKVDGTRIPITQMGIFAARYTGEPRRGAEGALEPFCGSITGLLPVFRRKALQAISWPLRAPYGPVGPHKVG